MKRQRTISINKHRWQDGRTAALLLVLLFWNTALFSSPLARVDVGNGLQSFDYAYTLQGWIKQVNNPQNTADANSLNDEFAYSLGYFAGDYQPINAQAAAPQQPVAGSLYNGNISSMVTAVAKLGTPQAMSYQYDQLNRLVASSTHAYSGAAWTPNNRYNEQLSYDANGNILSLERNAPATTGSGAATIDKLSYQYYNQQYSNGRNTNRLRRVTDAVATSGYETDLRSQTAEDNYRYDATGNLLQDKQEEIKQIDWTLSGKIAAVERVAGSQKPDLRFEYDALGNRTAKYLTPKRTDGTPNAALCMATFYVRDAQGNIMATYTKQGDEGTLQLDEQPIYGSSRLGVFRGSAATEGIVRGTRVYEASNHLGNVLLTFSDRKVAQPDGSYKADVTSANDYYSGGFEQYGRNFNASIYKFGYQGSEKDKEISAGNFSTFFREGDTRLLRWFSVDPKDDVKPWQSPYNCMDNNPILHNDPNGDIIPVLLVVGLVLVAEIAVAPTGNPSDQGKIEEARHDRDVQLVATLSAPALKPLIKAVTTPRPNSTQKSEPQIKKVGADKVQKETVEKNADLKVKRPYLRKDVIEKTFEQAKNEEGKVIDPTGKEIKWNKSEPRKGQWDMGHKPGQEYWRDWQKYKDGQMDWKTVKERYNDPTRYRPELPSTNRSHKFETK